MAQLKQFVSTLPSKQKVRKHQGITYREANGILLLNLMLIAFSCYRSTVSSSSRFTSNMPTWTLCLPRLTSSTATRRSTSFWRTKPSLHNTIKKVRDGRVIVHLVDSYLKQLLQKKLISTLFVYVIDWQKSTPSEREAHAEFLLNFLDQKSDSSRLSFAHQLIYISQGISRAYFAEIKTWKTWSTICASF